MNCIFGADDDSILVHLLVIGCTNLRDTKIISKQNPYVVLEYGDRNYRTMINRHCARHPIFNKKFVIPLLDGLQELEIAVWNSKTFVPEVFIGSGK
ncbi:hypothetical protein KP509_24G013500 [Ceratopteris richardii]|uniref:C2 domain-containing protein n=1 Tax=Ceratopteris richardii TaxID=49495 RepID=A0A8T2RVM2_CERRI|nr:hypothetical protein KP509_24G013500 [Ceratopteris richardii]